MPRQCAASAAEPGVVLVGTVLRPDDELAVCKVRVVLALLGHVDVLHGDGGGVGGAAVPVVGLARVGGRVARGGVVDRQGVVRCYDL